MAQPVIETKKLYKIFKLGDERVRALNGVDLKVEKGEFVAIVGTSGSGKSTLLNMLAGLDKPTKGDVVIAGQHIESMTEAELVKFRREHVGFIFQAYDLLPQFDAVENVALPLAFRGISAGVRRKKAETILKNVGLEKYIRHRPTQMSGGQQQRVGIARAFIAKPEVVFADEPTGNLDSVTTIEVMEMIVNMARKLGQTIVLVSHDSEMAGFADRIVTLKDGEIVKDERRNQGEQQ
jgi:putative ABC transport system ATP-binding protein